MDRVFVSFLDTNYARLVGREEQQVNGACFIACGFYKVLHKLIPGVHNIWAPFSFIIISLAAIPHCSLI